MDYEEYRGTNRGDQDGHEEGEEVTMEECNAE